MTTDIYKYWDSDAALKKYDEVRSWEQRFRSEVFFLEKIIKPGMSVLDVGCAAGDLYLALKEKCQDIDYTGLDITANMLQKAKKICHGAKFIHGNLLVSIPFAKGTVFDSVTATGVFQHEPEFTVLLQRMLELSKQYVLFDLKLFHTHKTICDIDIAYCNHEPRIFFIVYNIHELIQQLLQISNLESISIFGYYSGVNKSVRLADSIDEQVCSAHVLLTQNGENCKNIHLELNLPESMIETISIK